MCRWGWWRSAASLEVRRPQTSWASSHRTPKQEQQRFCVFRWERWLLTTGTFGPKAADFPPLKTLQSPSAPSFWIAVYSPPAEDRWRRKPSIKQQQKKTSWPSLKFPRVSSARQSDNLCAKRFCVSLETQVSFHHFCPVGAK